MLAVSLTDGRALYGSADHGTALSLKPSTNHCLPIGGIARLAEDPGWQDAFISQGSFGSWQHSVRSSLKTKMVQNIDHL